MNINRCTMLVLTLMIACKTQISAQEICTPTHKNGEGIQWEVEFVASSVEAMVLSPEDILNDIHKFWEDDKTYRLVALWHKIRGVPIDFEYFKRYTERLAKMSFEERRNLGYYLLTKRLMQEQDNFSEKAISHICSFLPENDIELHTKVYFTSALTVSGFAITIHHSHAVICTSDPYWEGSYSTVLNAMVHELFHTGYSANYFLFRREIEYENSELYNLVTRLQNEGMASYVAYKAIPMFPAPAEKDFRLLENMSDVRRLFKKLNKLFKKTETMPVEKIREESWKIGVQERAFYIVGAFMAQTIDDELGRAVLVETIIQGPRSFVNTYNTIADNHLKVFEFKSSLKTTSVYRKLRESIIQKDYKRFETLMGKIKENVSTPDKDVEYTLNRIGGLLFYQGEVELAMEVFRLNLKYFPKSLGAYSDLGDCFLKRGDTNEAVKVYEKILEMDPLNIDIERKLKILKGNN